MKKFAKILGVAASVGFIWGCAAMGPKAQVSLIQEEVKTKNVQKILMPSVTGIDSTGNTGKAILASSMKAYGGRARPTAAISPVLSAVPGLPKGLDAALFAGYQVEFIKALEQYRKDQKKPTSLELPPMAKFKVKNVKDLKGLFASVKSGIDGVPNLAEALQKGDAEAILQASEKHKDLLPVLSKASQPVLSQIKADHLLLSHVYGDEKAWEQKKEVELVMALVNVKTGKFRYFANVKAKKGAVPVPYMAQLGTMAQAIFDSVGEKDPLPSDSKSASLNGSGKMEVSKN